MSICDATEISLNDVKQMCWAAKSRGFNPDKIYVHWSAGKYGQYFDDYHLMIDGDATIQNPDDNRLDETIPHTWHRNSNSIGLSFAACYNATPGSFGFDTDFGPYPISPDMTEAMAKVISVLCTEFNLPIDEAHVLTHCEAAEVDGYGPSTTCERWDLWYLPDLPGDGQMKPGGEVLRGKAIWFQQN